jgi:hypothetical protein
VSLKVPIGVVGAAALVGIGLRVWILGTPLGNIDSDEAIVGLMARHIQQGEFPAIFWGQPYGGTTDSFLAAGVFSLFGSGRLALKAVPILLSAIASVLVYLVGRRTLGESPARLGASLFWIWSGPFVWFSTKALGGHYWPSLVMGLLVVLIVVRQANVSQFRSRQVAEVVLMGMFLGVGWWSGPQIAYVAIPSFLWFLMVKGKEAFRLLWGAPTAVAGALPWLLHNIKTDWVSLSAPDAFRLEPYVDRLMGFFSRSVPMALGLRTPYSGEWLIGPVGPPIYFAFLVGLLWFLVRRPRGSGLFLLTACLYPFLQSISPFSSYTDFPKYVLFLFPAISLLVGYGLTRFHRSQWLPSFGLILAALLSFACLRAFPGDPPGSPYAPDVQVPTDMQGLISEMDRRDWDYVFTDYWIAYRLAFESDERIVATPVLTTRYPPYERQVRSASPAYVFLEGSVLEPRFVKALGSAGVQYEVVSRGGFVAYKPSAKILPEELSGVW